MNCFVHADLDAFYASVEQHDHPDLKGKPVIVGGLPGDRRSVVSAASYEARRFGVHSAMPIAKAVKLCPDGVYLRGNMGRYREKSDEIMAIFAGFSPSVQQLSIDEAFIDITGMERLLGPPQAIAAR
ncbi:MAG: DNA polymerase IV, partial [Treponema sp.]|nr:DNA polymerase IV [Treponema sp.]